MKILHTESSDGWGGQEMRVVAEMQGLRSRGHVLELAAPASARIHREAAALGFRVHDVPIARKSLRGVFAMRELLQRERFDVVNTHSSPDSWLTVLANVLSAHPVPLVRTRHTTAAVSRKPTTSWVYQRSAAIVTTGEQLRQALIDVNGFRMPIRSVPTGVDPARFGPADPVAARAALGLPELFTVGIVAGVRSWKGHRYLVEAVQQLHQQGRVLQLLIVGDGPRMQEVQAQVAAAGLGEIVRFVGHDPQPERWMRAMDLFVLPSYANEGVPQALMQAMLSGLPCVTTHVGCISEIAHDGRTAVVVPTQDSAAVARAIAGLMDDPARRDSLGRAARALALERCTLDVMCDAMEEVFRSVVAGAARA
ncbi:MAG TPA: glycosyltransferase family 4 protein [Ramlibacter sp.]|uniref:glycosyltransferase family 4 protein n=1 Tax=Ramlibacter sp. TaxID=1917967 RepID=UPI002D7F5802|nr:glycosyltransferase family 4 protein [Ramlibacter sp.]HET8745219.1 glycosyltransferase family 4 protein [Ramlibacter sp.]